MTDAGYEHFEVEADVGIHAWGPTLAHAFAETALGVFALIVAPQDVVATEIREVRAQGENLEGLLVNWINECLYLHDIEAFVVAKVEVSVLEPSRVHAFLHGEEIDLARHPPGTVVKAATLHGVQVTDREGRHEVRLIVDI